MTGPAVVRVVVADDHPVFRDGLAGLIGAMPGREVVGTAGTGREALALVQELDPDLVVMDLHMPDLNGIEATRRVVAEHPRTAVLVLTMLEDDASVFAALQAGARGYLLKEAGPDEIARAIEAVTAGSVLLDAHIADRVMSSLPGAAHQGSPTLSFPALTAREREILDLVARGLSNTAIAERVYLSEKTVRNYVSTIFTKLHVEDRAAAVAAARDAGLGSGPV